MNRCGFEAFSLENDDRPGENGEEEEDEQNDLDNEAGVRDELENIHNSPLLKVA
jgi:hypothetical protein